MLRTSAGCGASRLRWMTTGKEVLSDRSDALCRGPRRSGRHRLAGPTPGRLRGQRLEPDRTGGPREGVTAHAAKRPPWQTGSSTHSLEARPGAERGRCTAGPVRDPGRLVNPDHRAEGARVLILAVFRLAVADYLG